MQKRIPLLLAALLLLALATSLTPSILARPTAAPQTAQLIAHWKLDEGSGNIAADSSGSGYDAVIANGGWSSDAPVAGANSDSLAFFGNTWVEAPPFDLNNDFSLVLWINPSDVYQGQAIIGQNFGEYFSEFLFGIYSNSYWFYLNGDEYLSDMAVPGWQQLILVGRENERGTDVALYRNGRLLWQHQFQTTADMLRGGEKWTLGANWDADEGPKQFFEGQMADVRLYDRALSQQEIDQIFAAQLVAHWKLDEGSGTIARDSSGNGYDGVITNGTWSTDVPAGVDFTRSLRLEGDGFVDAAVFDLDDNFTIAAWSKAEAFDRRAIIGKHTGSGANQFLMGYYNEAHGLNLQGQPLEAGLPLTGWQHLALVAESVTDGTELTLYRNGVAQWTRAIDTRLGDVANGRPWTIGRDWDPSGDNDFFQGNLADLRIYDRALTAEQVAGMALAFAETCAVPSDAYAAVHEAVADPRCGIVDVAAGSFPTAAMSPAHGLILRGAGPEQTILTDGGLDGPLLVVENDILISDLSVAGLVGVEGVLSVGGTSRTRVERLAIRDSLIFSCGAFLDNEGRLEIDDSLLEGNGLYCSDAIRNNSGGELLFQDSAINSNTGPAIHNIDGRVVVSGSTIAGNLGGDNAALMIEGGSLLMVNSTLSQSENLGGGPTALVLDDSEAVIQGSLFADNSTADWGGALYMTDSRALIEDTIFTGNESGYGGGAVYVADSSLEFFRSTFSDNVAGTRAGASSVASALEINQAYVELINSTISGNRTGPEINGLGTAIMLRGARPFLELVHTTVAGNDIDKPYDVHGLWVFTGFAHIYNSILANNGETNCRLDRDGLIAVTKGVISDDASCPGASVSDELNLGPLAGNGGLTETHAIGEDSAANNAGDLNFCTMRDQRGVLRSRQACDVGAFEYVDRQEIYLPVVLGPS